MSRFYRRKLRVLLRRQASVSGLVECPKCEGRGWYMWTMKGFFGQRNKAIQRRTDCRQCKGSGRITQQDFADCVAKELKA